MAMDYVTLGPTPAGEDCEQLGPNYNNAKARKECLIYKKQLQRMFPGGFFNIKSFSHDFGTYHEVVAYYDDNNDDAMGDAFEIENNTPEYWDDEAKAEILALTVAV